MNWGGAERRRFVRANFPCKIIVYAPEEHVIKTHTKDVSAGGVRVVIGEKLGINSVVGVEIYLQDKPIICKGRVVWVRDNEKASIQTILRFMTGIEFNQIKEEDKQIIDNFVKAVTFGNK